jgi:AraC-like DNA-binding protein
LAAIKAALNRLNGRRLKNFDYRSFRFSTYPSFSRSFKRLTGMTPREWVRRGKRAWGNGKMREWGNEKKGQRAERRGR